MNTGVKKLNGWLGERKERLEQKKWTCDSVLFFLICALTAVVDDVRYLIYFTDS